MGKKSQISGIVPRASRYIILFQAVGVILIGILYVKGFDTMLRYVVIISVALVLYNLDSILKIFYNLISSEKRQEDD
jgi:hypothetical protein